MGFLRVYGWSGVLMIVAFLLSSVWTAALAVLQLYPTQVANYLMDTGQLDYGDFWVLLKADDPIGACAAVMLACFALGYCGLVVLMLFHTRRRALETFRASDGQRLRRGPGRHVLTSIAPASSKPPTSARGGLHGLLFSDGRTSTSPRVSWADSFRTRMVRHLQHDVLPTFRQDSPIFALPKLVLQTTTLLRLLDDGMPPTVIVSYASLLAINWFVTGYCSITMQIDPRLVIVRIFYSFDLFFAVLAPLQVLLYAYYNFDFNRSEFATRVATFNTANFDRTARLFANPTEVSRFRIAFQSLQLTTAMHFLIRGVLNLFSIVKWARVIRLLGTPERSQQPANAISVVPVGHRRRTRHWLLLGILFFGLGTATFMYTIVAVTTTLRVCRPFAQCQVPSYHWNVGATQCSCLVFVDRQTRVATYAEWQDPVDTTRDLAELAAPGYLRIIQIVNRQVGILPDELRRCKNLEQLTLLYTKTTMIPDWASEFTRLEYFHIEGDLMHRQLTRLPPNLFTKMPRLLFLHLGTLVSLPSVPEVSNLHRLKYAMFAMLHSVPELPSLDGLTSLEQLSIIDGIQMNTLPSFRKLVNLRVLTISSRMPVCCNGFINGTCDLTLFACLDRTAAGELPVRCVQDRMATEDYKRLNATNGPKCDTSQNFDLKDVRPTVVSTDLACGGVMYRQCTLNGSPGMCFPARMMPISCQLNTAFQAMRRQQIQQQVGEPCDPTVEAWLGCQAN